MDTEIKRLLRKSKAETKARYLHSLAFTTSFYLMVTILFYKLFPPDTDKSGLFVIFFNPLSLLLIIGILSSLYFLILVPEPVYIRGNVTKSNGLKNFFTRLLTSIPSKNMTGWFWFIRYISVKPELIKKLNSRGDLVSLPARHPQQMTVKIEDASAYEVILLTNEADMIINYDAQGMYAFQSEKTTGFVNLIPDFSGGNRIGLSIATIVFLGLSLLFVIAY